MARTKKPYQFPASMQLAMMQKRLMTPAEFKAALKGGAKVTHAKDTGQNTLKVFFDDGQDPDRWYDESDAPPTAYILGTVAVRAALSQWV